MVIPGWLLFTLRLLLGVSLGAYGAYTLIAVWAARQWRRERLPLDPDWTPPVTLLKPVRGVDPEAYANFASFCRLDYPPDRVQIIFGALDRDDPALALARQLQSDFPLCDITLIVAGPDAVRGHNLKVCNLLAMLPAAKHDLLVLCDSDMRVRPDYLRRIVAPFQPGERGKGKGKRETPQLSSLKSQVSHSVGLVTCPYRGCQPQSFAAIFEALGIGADFIPSALVSRALEGVSFAFGSTIALPRKVLAEIGGFETLLDELADDFRLGDGARRAGYKVVLSDYVVNDVLGRERFRSMWARRLRWARTVRSCRPAGYAGACITYGTAIGLLFALAMDSAPGWFALAAVMALRIATALLISSSTQDGNVKRFWPILPLSDLISFALYVASFCGNRITWRGEQFRLLAGGKMTPLPQKQKGRRGEGET